MQNDAVLGYLIIILTVLMGMSIGVFLAMVPS